MRNKLKLGVILTVLAVLTSTIFSCKVMLVPPKNPKMLDSVNSIWEKTDALYTTVIGSSDKSYQPYASDYEAIVTKVDSVITANEVRPKAGLIVSQAKRFQTFFLICKNGHETKKTLNNGQLASNKKYLWSLFEPWLISEASLK